MDHWAYPGVAAIRELGYADGGYDNNYRLENEITHRWALQNRLNRIMSVMHERTKTGDGPQIPAWETSLETDEITVGLVFLKTAECASFMDSSWYTADQSLSDDMPEPKAFASGIEAKDYLVSLGILDADDLVHFQDLNAIATYGQLFSVVGNFYAALMGWR